MVKVIHDNGRLFKLIADAVIDYKKVISCMDNMPHPDDGSLNGRMNTESGSLNGIKDDENGSLNPNDAEKPDANVSVGMFVC